MVYRKRESREQRYHDATLPRGSLSLRAKNPSNDCISDSVLDLHVADNRPSSYDKGLLSTLLCERLRRDEKLVLNVHKML